MANYILDNNAADINTAIGKVLSPDTTLTGTDNSDPSLITAGAVKTYVDSQVGDFAGKTVTTESTGINNTDNETSIPTSAAVKDFVDTNISSLSTTPNNRLIIKVMPVEANQDFVANYDIPDGYKATELQIYASSGHNTTVSVSEGNLTNGSLTTKASSTTQGSRTMSFSSDVTSTSTNYLRVGVYPRYNMQFYGGYITLVAV